MNFAREEENMGRGLPAGIPILILILGVLITKRMTEALIVSSITAVIMCDGTNAVTAYVDKMYADLEKPWQRSAIPGAKPLF